MTAKPKMHLFGKTSRITACGRILGMRHGTNVFSSGGQIVHVSSEDGEVTCIYCARAKGVRGNGES